MSPLKSRIFLLSLFAVFFAAQKTEAACVNVTGTQCVVTNPRGDLSEGTLVACLTDARCQKITFGVDHVDPLIDWAELAGGRELDGRVSGGGQIHLTYDTNYTGWPNSSYRDCLLRVLPLPPTDSTAGVKISNLTIDNPYGAGICIQTRAATGTHTNDNEIRDVTVSAGGFGIGIDLDSSHNNILENVVVTGEGRSVSKGIYMNGVNNRVEGGRIENFSYGVYEDASSTLNRISQVRYSKIRSRPLYYMGGQAYRPRSLKAAFVTSNSFTLTGIVRFVVRDSFEVYRYTSTSDGGDYEYRFTIPSQALLERESSPCSPNQLAASDRRFVSQITSGAGTLRPTDSVALMTLYTDRLGAPTSSEFSTVYSGANPIAGDPNCNQTSNRWFWYSYDLQTPAGGTRGWSVDFDCDGLANGGCSDPNICEDLNRNCRVGEGESDPEDWTSRYDFDCDGRGDNIYVGGFGQDNCYNDFKSDGTTPYTYDADRLTYTCGTGSADPANATRFRTWNPNQRDSDQDGLGDLCETDADNDGIPDGMDNCPTVFNPDQRNSDQFEDRTVMPPRFGLDNAGDACKRIRERHMQNPPQDGSDTDGDLIPNVTDNCPAVGNNDQRDDDRDGVGNYCDIDLANDADADTVLTLADNCPFDPNPDQADNDRDRAGDACDFDDDNDGLADAEEDLNGDGIVDPGETNPKNSDTDLDGLCDGPGWGFAGHACIRPQDNCPVSINRDQNDRDEDGIGDLCDAAPDTWAGNGDSDRDGVLDATDNCPAISNPLQPVLFQPNVSQQPDWDRDTVGDPCDPDDDNDGLDDATESTLYDPRRRDRQVPYFPSHQMADGDNDNFFDGVDVCPNYPDLSENQENPTGDRLLLPDSRCGNYPASDIDNDAISNSRDNCVFIANFNQRDSDGDRKGDACDLDDDNDDNSNATVDECWRYLHDDVPYVSYNPPAVRNIFGCNPSLRECRTCDFDESANFRLKAWDPNSDHQIGNIFSAPDTKCDGGGGGYGLQNSFTRCQASDGCPEFFNPQGREGVCGPALPAFDISPDDLDLDGVVDPDDNCTGDSNINQSDIDRDGLGDACDPDIDGDGLLNESDNCSLIANADQLDTDGDLLGDVCDPHPASKNSVEVQGGGTTAGGCSLMNGNQTAIEIFSLLAANFIGLFCLRFLLPFLKNGKIGPWIMPFRRF